MIKRANKAVSQWIRDQDEIVAPGYEGFHYQTDFKQKTCLGGTASLCVTAYLLYMTYIKGKQMLGLEEPYISSLEETMDYDLVGKVPFSSLAIPIFEILQGGDGTIDLDEANHRQYIHVRINNYVKRYPNGELEVENNFY